MACAACGSNKPSISIQQMVKSVGGVLPYLKFAYCAYPTQFVAAFKNVGITINNESQLDTLAEISDNGTDVQGIVPNPTTGQPMPFSVVNTLNQISTSQPMENTSCATS